MIDELDIIKQDNNTNNIDQEIHIYKQARGRKTDLIIIGLEFTNKEDNKLFLTNVKKKFGIGGCYKEMPELSKDKMAFVFTGTLIDKIKNLLINDYGKNENLIKIHG